MGRFREIDIVEKKLALKNGDKILSISSVFLKEVFIKRYGFEIIVKGIKL